MPNEVFNVGINEHIINKTDPSSGINLAANWVQHKLTCEQLLDHIRAGHAFSAHFKNEYRKSDNFICSDVIAADIDHGFTLEEALDDIFIKTYASFIYTTPSHTDDHHRFRVVFLLKETITSKDDWANCLLGLAVKLRGDRAVNNASRMFYGSTGAQFWTLGNSLPPEHAKQMIEMGRVEKARAKAQQYGDTITSPIKLNSGQLVKLANGEMRAIEGVPKGATVFCPYHNDTHPSAFIVESSRQANGVHCRTCNMTFWGDEVIPYDFDGFDQLVERKIAEQERRALEKEKHPCPLRRTFPPMPLVRSYQRQYLPEIGYQTGITLIKSPKGSGKTQALATFVKRIREKYFDPLIVDKVDRPRSVLLIGHRRSLIQEAANRLGLDCYLDDERTGRYAARRFGYAICLDSLPKINQTNYAGGEKVRVSKPPQYDVVILDESEQVFSHLMADTLAQRAGMESVYRGLISAMNRAKAVYALDADLGLLTSDALSNLRQADWSSNSCMIVYNKPVPVIHRRTMEIYKSQKHLQDRMLDAIRAGKRVFITCNSKILVEKLTHVIETKCGASVSMISITSDNSQEKDVKAFVENIQTEYLKKKVLICSPSLGTGIDISFPDGRCEVDEVFGFFNSYVNTHTDIDQQLSRVRNPGAVSVWFDGAMIGFETNFDVIRYELGVNGCVPSAILREQDESGQWRINVDDPLLNIAAHVKMIQNSSRRNIKPLFMKLRRDNGWDIVHIEAPDKKDFNTDLINAANDIKERKILAILQARELTDDEFQNLNKDLKWGTRLTKIDKSAMERYRLFKTYQTPVTRDLIELDSGGMLRDQCANYRRIFGDGIFARFRAEWARDIAAHRRPLPRCAKWEVAAIAMTSVGLINDGDLNRTAVIRSSDLDPFVSFCILNRVTIESILDRPLRNDINDKPMMMLNEFLGIVGLRLIPAGRKVRRGGSSNEYKLDQNSLDVVEKVAMTGYEIYQLNQ